MTEKRFSPEDLQYFFEVFQKQPLSEAEVKIIAREVAKEVNTQMAVSLRTKDGCDKERAKINRKLTVITVVAVIALLLGAEAMGIKTYEVLFSKAGGMITP